MTDRLISSIHVESLFGLYTYSVPPSGELTNAAILYGDNGIGKSTVLRLAFHLLSAAHNRGHRSALYETDFERLEVSLASGIRLTAQVIQREPFKVLSLVVLKGQKRLAVWDYQPRPERAYADEGTFYVEDDGRGRRVIQRVKASPGHKTKEDVPQGEQAYLTTLNQYVPTLFILNADRRLDSDSVSDPSDEVELRRVMRYGEPQRLNELVARSREIALSQALSAAARWISRKAVIGTNQGSTNVHSVYGDVLRKIVSPNRRATESNDESAVNLQDLLDKLTMIDSKSAEHARYELATHLSTTDFQKALKKSSTKSSLAAELLQPYIQSLESRLDAVEPIYQLIDRFVSIVNSLLSDKAVTFKLSQGFSIKNRLGLSLSPAQLSSGEQQLLLLFCYVLTARDAPTVFMIDEPEISLNVKWQRQLIQSLLDITEGANIQFVLASHSMELLAQHRNRVVKLENQS